MLSRKRKLVKECLTACAQELAAEIRLQLDPDRLKPKRNKATDVDIIDDDDSYENYQIKTEIIAETTLDGHFDASHTIPKAPIQIKAEVLSDSEEPVQSITLVNNNSDGCRNCVNIQAQLNALKLEIKSFKQSLQLRDDSILQYLAEIKDQITKEETLKIKCLTVEDFDELEKFLQDPFNIKRFIKQISFFGGSSCRAFLQNTLRNILIDEVAEKFSLCGRSGSTGSKRPFETTKTFEALTVACTDNYDTNIFKMRKAISDWLNHARERISRR